MRVFRLEQKDTGLGPYKAWHSEKSKTKRAYLSRMCGRCDHLPTPQEEGILFPDQEYVCGFATSKHLKNWFRDDTKKLLDRGFEVAEYCIEDRFVRVGKLQLIFNPKQAKSRRVIKLRGL